MGVEPRTVATMTLAVKHSNHSARSNQPPSISSILKVECAGFFTSKFSHFETRWSEINRGILLDFFICTYSTLLHLPPLRFHCVGGCWGSNPELLWLKRCNHSARYNQPPSIRAILKVGCAGFFTSKFSHFETIWSEIDREYLLYFFICTHSELLHLPLLLIPLCHRMPGSNPGLFRLWH